ncbi:MAG TPA: hypothetical protein VF245_02870 [Solirubrobacterales bacterium]
MSKSKKQSPLLSNRLLESHGAVAASLIAVLYLAGLTTLIVKLSDAGLNVQDALPLFSLDQLLRAGLTWAYPAFPAVAVLAVVYIGSISIERMLGREAVQFENARAKILDTEERSDWQQEFAKHRTSTAWDRVSAEVTKAIEDGASDDHKDTWVSFRRKLRLFNAWTEFIYFLLLVSCIFLPVLIAVVTVLLLLLGPTLIGARPAKQALLPYFAIVATGFLVNAVINPQPLPHAVVSITAPPHSRTTTSFGGSLVVVSNDTWYLGDGHGEIVGIPITQIKSTAVYPRQRRDSVLNLLIDATDP